MPVDSLLAILGMAALTYGIRAGGLLLADRLPSDGFVAAWMRHIPGAVLAALVAPAVIGGGWPEWAAAAITAIAFVLARNLLLAMATGVASVFLFRLLLGA